MNTKYFIGVVPPKEFLKQVEQLQRRWINKLGVEPHITLKAQGGLTSDEKWISKVKKICEDFSPFQVSIGKPQYFGENILYLSVHSNNLHYLHQKLGHEISPSNDIIESYFELVAYIPHLTLGKEHYSSSISAGLSNIELKGMEQLATKELSPYHEFTVNFIRIYKFHTEKKRYEKHLDIPLGN